MQALEELKPYYADESVKLYHADCRQVVLPVVPLVLTDPPYELVATGGGIGRDRQYTHEITGNNLDKGFDEAMLAAFPNWICFCSKDQIVKLITAAGERRWVLVTWNKPNPTPLVNGNYLPDTEYIIHAFQSSKFLYGDFRDRARYIVHPVEKNEFNHPTVKPVAVVSKMVRLGSAPGDTILDPFCGSGTTLLAAKLCGRKAIGIEISEEYCKIARERISQGCLAL